MERRRAPPARPTSEEEAYWAAATKALRELSDQQAAHPTLDLIGKANRLMAAWPSGDDLPSEGWKSLKENYKKLSTNLDDIQKHSDAEVKCIDEAIEALEVLLGLRNHNEKTLQDKRNKRPKASSPSSTPGTAGSTTSSRGVSITLPPRTSSVGPSVLGKKKDARVHPLQPGRKIAFYNVGSGDADWILAIVIKVVSSRDGRYTYQVRDAEEQDGAPAVVAPQKHVIPLPDPKMPPTHDIPVGSSVLALYPDTSCFYRAQVIATPKSMLTSSVGRQPVYKLRFDDDEGQQRIIPAEWVVEAPDSDRK